MKAKVKRTRGNLVLTISGSIDEQSKDQLTELGALVTKAHVVLAVGDVGPINSTGFRYWLAFLAGVAEKTTFELTLCNELLLSYCSLMPTLSYARHITSVRLSFACSTCGATEKAVLDVSAMDTTESVSGPVMCPHCSGVMTLVELPPDGLQFLVESREAS